jgi:hypothetical protein
MSISINGITHMSDIQLQLQANKQFAKSSTMSLGNKLYQSDNARNNIIDHQKQLVYGNQLHAAKDICLVQKHISQLKNDNIHPAYDGVSNNNVCLSPSTYDNKTSDEERVDTNNSECPNAIVIDNDDYNAVQILIKLQKYILKNTSLQCFLIMVIYHRQIVSKPLYKQLLTVIPNFSMAPQKSISEIAFIDNKENITKYTRPVHLVFGGFSYTSDWLDLSILNDKSKDNIRKIIINHNHHNISGMCLYHYNLHKYNVNEISMKLHVPGFTELWNQYDK